jgi:hypothetical protein
MRSVSLSLWSQIRIRFRVSLADETILACRANRGYFLTATSRVHLAHLSAPQDDAEGREGSPLLAGLCATFASVAQSGPGLTSGLIASLWPTAGRFWFLVYPDQRTFSESSARPTLVALEMCGRLQ